MGGFNEDMDEIDELKDRTLNFSATKTAFYNVKLTEGFKN